MKLAPLVLSAFLLVSCSASPALAQVPQSTATLEPAVSAPAPDYPAQIATAEAARQLAQDAANAAIDRQQEAERAALDAQARAQNAEVESKREDNRRAEIAVTAQWVEVTKVAYTEQAQAEKDLREIEFVKASTENMAQQTELLSAQTKAKTAVTQLVLSALMVVAVIAICVFAVWKMATQPEPVEDDGDSLLSGLQAPQQISTRAGEVFEHSVNITSSEKMILYQAYHELGNNFTYKNMTPKYFSDPDWRKRIRPELLRESPNGVAYCALNKYDALYMTDAGEKWLGVKARPSSPRAEVSPENATEAEEPQRNATQEAEGEGKP